MSSLPDLLALSLQALETTSSRNINFAFKHALVQTCQIMHIITSLIRTSIHAEPTLAMRELLQSPSLIARASSAAVEVWPCLPLDPSQIIFLSNKNSTCTQEIPISFAVHGVRRNGFLDPVTNVVHYDGTPTTCDSVKEVPVSFGNATFLYQSDSGSLKKLKTVIPLRIGPLNYTSLPKLRRTIFSEQIMEEWQSSFARVSLNSVARTFLKQQEVYKELGLQPESPNTPPPSAKTYLSKLAGKTFFGFLAGLPINLWQVWVFFSCLIVTLAALTWFCCPSLLTQARIDPAGRLWELFQSAAHFNKVAHPTPTPPSTQLSTEIITKYFPPRDKTKEAEETSFNEAESPPLKRTTFTPTYPSLITKRPEDTVPTSSLVVAPLSDPTPKFRNLGEIQLRTQAGRRDLILYPPRSSLRSSNSRNGKGPSVASVKLTQIALAINLLALGVFMMPGVGGTRLSARLGPRPVLDSAESALLPAPVEKSRPSTSPSPLSGSSVRPWLLQRPRSLPPQYYRYPTCLPPLPTCDRRRFLKAVQEFRTVARNPRTVPANWWERNLSHLNSSKYPLPHPVVETVPPNSQTPPSLRHRRDVSDHVSPLPTPSPPLKDAAPSYVSEESHLQ